jgi:hypothetical protein
MKNLLPLSAVLGLMEPLSEGGPRRSYRDCWTLAVNGVLPATQVRGRWHVARTDLPAIAVLLGMRLRAETTQPSRVAA